MDFTQIIIGVIGLCVAITTALIIPYIKNKIGEQKFNELVDKAELTSRYIKIFVTAAEQTFGKEQCEEKKAYVIELVKAKLEELNIVVDLDQLDAAVESAVLELHNSLK